MASRTDLPSPLPPRTRAPTPASAVMPAPAVRIDALVERARAYERSGRAALARGCYEEALRLWPDSGALVTAAALVRWIGNTHRAEGDPEAAVACYTSSLAAAEMRGDDLDTAHALNWLGITQHECGRLDDARELYQRARRLAARAGDVRLEAMIGQNIGAVANLQGDLRLSLRCYRRSLARYRGLGERAMLAALLNNLGMLQTDLERWQAAEKAFREAASLCRELGDRRTRAMIEVNRVAMLFRRGELDRALRACRRAHRLAQRVGHRQALGEVHKWYGILHRDAGRLERAAASFDDAVEIATRLSDPVLEAEVLRERAPLLLARNQNQAALQALNRAHRIFHEVRAQRLLQDVDRSIHDLETLFLDVVRTWGESIEEKDRYTAGHCQRVADLACMLAREAGLEEWTLTWFRMGALLHDVGKTAVPSDILNKEGPLTDDEWTVMRRHTVIGDALLADVGFPWDVRPMVRGHHERWDGSGYPDGIAGEAIPLSARILCIADVFDALTTTRSYRPAHTRDAALDIMRRDAGRMFDPDLFRRFEAVLLTAG